MIRCGFRDAESRKDLTELAREGSAAHLWRGARGWRPDREGMRHRVPRRSGLIALLHRLGMEHRKPKTVSRKLDPEKQATFIRAYEDMLNYLDADEVVLFADAVNPTHAVLPVGRWATKDTPIAAAQTSGRQRLNIHGAIDLETGHTRMLAVETVDAASTIKLMIALLSMYPQASDPPVPGQRQLPLREADSSLAGAAGPSDQAPLHPNLLPLLGSDRAAWGDEQAQALSW
jgi:hypothetical protein